ncbi:hypothetical protein CA54_26710 [Symmachiella macrocystis]|uniref:Uncharacterized protein n=1 Tax=Symmachiella macrocystis TaxID=2527985 RepID=A0A5C6BR04_9PLAN|nr:hypothetical protein CA54_26710 [Symmachiella macrocystis]
MTETVYKLGEPSTHCTDRETKSDSCANVAIYSDCLPASMVPAGIPPEQVGSWLIFLWFPLTHHSPELLHRPLLLARRPSPHPE